MVGDHFDAYFVISAASSAALYFQKVQKSQYILPHYVIYMMLQLCPSAFSTNPYLHNNGGVHDTLKSVLAEKWLKRSCGTLSHTCTQDGVVSQA
jgi:hypothetical protein